MGILRGETQMFKMGSVVKMLILLSSIAFAASQDSEIKLPKGERQKKIFFVSTSSTTSTVSTTTLCYFTNAAIAACKRKRRAFSDEETLTDIMITPSLVTENSEMEHEIEIMNEENVKRKGKSSPLPL